MPKRRAVHQPDRGWAWVVLVASLGSHYLSGSYVYSVGVLHTGLLDKFDPDTVTMVAITGALNSSLMTLAAPLASYIINRFGCRTCAVLGGMLCFAGYTSSSFVTSVLLLFFTFGVTAGVGLGLVYSATNVTIGFYFNRLRGLTSALSNASSAIGILSGSVIFQSLIDTFGVNGTFLLLGGASLHYCFLGMFFRPTIYEGKARQKDRIMDIVVEKDQEPIEMRVVVCPEKATTVAELRTLLSQTTTQCKNVSKTNDMEVESGSLLEKSGEHQQRSNDMEEESGSLLEKSGEHQQRSNDMEEESGSLLEKSGEHQQRSNDMEEESGSLLEKSGEHQQRTSLLEICEKKPQGKKVSSKRGDTEEGRRSLLLEKSGNDQGEPQGEVIFDTTGQAVSRDSQLSNTQDQTTNSLQAVPTTNFSDFPASEHTSDLSPPGDFRGRLSTEQKHLRLEIAADEVSERLGNSNVAASSSSLQDEQKASWAGRSRTKSEGSCCGTYIELLTNVPLMLHAAALFVSSAHVSGVFLHLPEYVRQYGTQPFQAAELFLAVGCTSLLSKLSCAFALSDPTVDPLILSVGMMGINGIITCLFPLFADSYGMQMLFSALFGLYFGGLYAIANPILVRFAGVSRLAEAYGISYFILGLGYLLGPMMAAMVVDGGGTYGHSFLFLGILMLCGAFLDMVSASFLQSRLKTEGARQTDHWSMEEDRGVASLNQSPEEVEDTERPGGSIDERVLGLTSERVLD